MSLIVLACGTLSSGGERLVLPLNAGWRFRGFALTSLKHDPPAPDFPPAQWPAVAAPDFDDSSWISGVSLPHDFVIAQALDGTFSPHEPSAGGTGDHGYLPVGVGWYRLQFNVSAGALAAALGNAGGHTGHAGHVAPAAWLDFGGVFRNSSVWLNGHLLGRHSSGYTSFRYAVGAGSSSSDDDGAAAPAPPPLQPGRNVLAVRADATRSEGWFYVRGLPRLQLPFPLASSVLFAHSSPSPH